MTPPLATTPVLTFGIERGLDLIPSNLGWGVNGV
jgi:hypothetical protein